MSKAIADLAAKIGVSEETLIAAFDEFLELKNKTQKKTKKKTESNPDFKVMVAGHINLDLPREKWAWVQSKDIVKLIGLDQSNLSLCRSIALVLNDFNFKFRRYGGKNQYLVPVVCTNT